MDVDGVSIQPDMTGRHEHRTTKLLPEARNTVIDYICSYKATESRVYLFVEGRGSHVEGRGYILQTSLLQRER